MDSQSKKNDSPGENPNNLLKKYLLIYNQSNKNNDELEVRFGTNYRNSITKIKFHNIIEKLKSLGFVNTNTEHYLNIINEFVDSKTGRTKNSNIRTQLYGIHNIKKYCKSNTLDLENMTQETKYGVLNVTEHDQSQIEFIQKFRKKNVDEILQPIDFRDFEFRVNYKTEKNLKFNNPLVQNLLSNWSDSKKVFRLIKRLSFKRDDIPYVFDLSIVKSSKKIGSRLISEYNLESSNVLNNQETYEVEIELDNTGSAYIYDPNELLKSFKNGIKIVLSALQKTNYPVSYKEQALVINEYMNVIHNDSPPDRKIYTSDFIGPSSISLEVINVIPITDDLSYPNIRLPYTVTEKADGTRCLLYISSIGKIYMINVNMEVIFTGCISRNTECYNTIIDGEHVERDKNNNFINYYLCFDIYYINKKSVMEFPFVEMEGLVYTKKISKEIFRYKVLLKTLNSLSIESVTNSRPPLVIKPKEFYKNTSKTIFAQCNEILNKVNEGGFLYETDGLIFTPINTGVGSDVIGETIQPRKITWRRSFKWKPPEFNTIDFLVTTKKNERNQDMVSNELAEGTNMISGNQIKKYKTIELRVGFDERKHGFINPCKNIIDDNLPDVVSRDTSLYRPVKFQPTNPTPDFPVHLCNIYLDGDSKMLIEDGSEFFEDKTIVEFRFEKQNNRFWQWVPIRVRHDKTADFKLGRKNYGNAYHVANSVWKSIHNPVTERMIRSGEDIPEELNNEDVYYKSAGRQKTITRSLRDFHNLVVKRELILSVSKRGNTLIDQSVGKAGDFPKWKAAKLNFVFGIDYSKDNIENRIDGACARYLNERMKWRSLPKVLYLHGDSSLNIRNGDAFRDQKSKQIANAIFGKGTRDKTILGNGVFKHYGKGEQGFDIVSNQFSIHYFFENNVKLNNFLRNVSECCKVGGYFIGACFDGKRVFNELRNKPVGGSVLLMQGERKMWELTKNYDKDEFSDDDSSLGYTISVYQETINKTFSEFLVNFDYLTRLIENYGFTPITTEEAAQIGFLNGIGSVSLLFDRMKNFIKRSKSKNHSDKFGTAPNMNHNEKKISFLNNYFIFKKRRPVNAESVYKSIVKNEKIKKKFKFRKLKKKIKLKMKK